MKYQYDNRTMKAICIHCGKDYNEHKEDLECPLILERRD